MKYEKDGEVSTGMEQGLITFDLSTFEALAEKVIPGVGVSIDRRRAALVEFAELILSAK